MNLVEFNDYLNSFLCKENFLPDPSKNGIQIQNEEPLSKEIKTVAFAVDACEESALIAIQNHADVLVCHHGLFWGNCSPIVDSHYKRVSTFIKNDLALIAYHLPLDANNPYGNNFGLAHKIGLKNTEQFGFWHNMKIGVHGEFDYPKSIDEISLLIGKHTHTEPRKFSFGKKQIKTVGISSGGSSDLTQQAADEKLDLFISGEFSHEDYHLAKELGINVIAAGHYGTEITGVSLLKEKIDKELALKTIFIDLPTGL